MITSRRVQFAARAGLIHLVGCFVVAILVAGVVFSIWFPYPYRELAGGRELFLLIILVDVVCGPLLTLILASPTKPRSELMLDLGLVVLIQLSALVYGLYSLSLARPVALVFEVDRFRAVTAADIDPADLALAPPPFASLSWTGPRLLGLRAAKNGEEQLKSIELGLQGIEPSLRPQWWQDYGVSVDKVLAKAKPLAQLRNRYPKYKDVIDDALGKAKATENNTVWLPLVGRKSSEWVALLDAKSARPIAYLPLDGF